MKILHLRYEPDCPMIYMANGAANAELVRSIGCLSTHEDESAYTPTTSDVCLIRNNSPSRRRKRRNAGGQQWSPWIEVELQFSASMVRIEIDSKGVYWSPGGG
jgi:hypothetical protein